MAVQTQIQARRGTAATWTSTNPTLAAGETGYETDTGKFKIGTGSTAWASLGYFNQDPVTTKGDLFTFSTTDARLAVGSNGETLVADSSTSTGLRYTAGNPIPNPIINSCFDIWQRGTTISLGASASYTAGFLADRWQTSTSSGQASTISRQATGDTTNLPFIQYALRYQRNSGQTGTATMGFYQSFETVNSIPFVGKTITLSFYARSGADFSPTSDAIAARVYSGTGTDQSVFTYTGLASVINETKNLTSTWQRFTVTSAAPVATTVTELAVGFEWAPTGTAGAADYFEVTGVQVDIGSVALPVRRNGATIQGELAACQRYYYRETATSTSFTWLGNVGFASSTTNVFIPFRPPVTMRIAPSSLDFSNLSAADGVTNLSVSSASLDANFTTSTPAVNLTVTGAAQFRPYIIRANNSTSAFIGFSAEL